MEEGMLPPFSSLPAVLDHMPQPKPRGPYTGNSIRTKQRRAAKAAGKENPLVEYKKKIDNEKEVVACGTQTEIQPDRVSCGTQTEELPIERVSCETQTTATVPPDIELAIFSQNISSATGTGVTSLDSASNDNSPATNKTKQKRKKKRVRKKRTDQAKDVREQQEKRKYLRGRVKLEPVGHGRYFNPPWQKQANALETTSLQERLQFPKRRSELPAHILFSVRNLTTQSVTRVRQS
ncbi:hypothetical protein CYMTET_6573 [Cymbomonas tetramitiformis]|uniref:Uncharacterized protein n=1 Tax=Cymbomonas tetramitiformis TaxID=36881 RepID=A0AAE0LIA0_9CHLO|nr:hypothetical protein CYMTET_6573 [Cymbomonas tetramitiformis]